jgi:hypothetical protein
MSRRGWGWWQQLQSGEYRKTPPLRTSSPYCTTLPRLPKYRYFAELRSEFHAVANANNQVKSSLPNATKEPQITIAKIQKMLNEGYEANKLHELLSSALNRLREIYKTNNSNFSTNDLLFLQQASDINNSLVLLIKTKEELFQLILQFREQYPNSSD